MENIILSAPISIIACVRAGVEKCPLVVIHLCFRISNAFENE